MQLRLEPLILLLQLLLGPADGDDILTEHLSQSLVLLVVLHELVLGLSLS